MRRLYPAAAVRRAVAATGEAPGRPPFGPAWLDRYLGHFFPDEPSRLHEDLVADLADLHTRRGARLCLRAPRGAGKTTLMSKAYPLWCALEGVEPLILLLAETGPQAKLYLDAIKREVESNPVLARDYPGSAGRGPVWQADRVRLRNGCEVVARGAGGRILGLAARNRRPTLVVVDDGNERADAYSATKRRRKLDWFYKDVLPAGEPGTNVLVAGTPIHREAIVCDLAGKGAWDARRYRSVMRWPDRMDLWDEWERRLSNLADPDRAETARRFYDGHRGEMEAGAEVLWPSRFPLAELMARRAEVGPSAFASEYQDTPGTDGATEWPAELFDHPGLWFDDWPGDLTCAVQALDPSKGADAKSGDDQAHVLVGVRPNGDLYFDCVLRREPDYAERAVELARQWRPRVLVFEGNGTMGSLAASVRGLLAERNLPLPWVEKTHTEPKLFRIRLIGPYLSRRQVRVRNTPGGRALVDQWRDVPSGDKDDACDAAATALYALLELLGLAGRPG